MWSANEDIVFGAISRGNSCMFASFFTSPGQFHWLCFPDLNMNIMQVLQRVESQLLLRAAAKPSETLENCMLCMPVCSVCTWRVIPSRGSFSEFLEDNYAVAHNIEAWRNLESEPTSTAESNKKRAELLIYIWTLLEYAFWLLNDIILSYFLLCLCILY